MKRLTGLALLIALLGWLSSTADAGGLRRLRAGSDVDVALDCSAPCDWVEQTVTCYRPEYRTRTVPHTVCRVVPREIEERYHYTEMVREVRPEKRTETYCTIETKQVPHTCNVTVPVLRPEQRTLTYSRLVTKQVPYTYTVSIPVCRPETRTETYYTTVTRQVPYTYSARVPYTVPEKRVETYYACVPEEVTRQVTVCRKVCYEAVDPCTGCAFTAWRSVPETQSVKSVVNRLEPRTREVTVNVCHYRAEERTAMRTVCESVPRTREVTVNVPHFETQQRTAMRTICEQVPETRQVTVNVCHLETRQQTVMQTVCESVPRTREVNVNVVSYKPVERTGTRKRVICDTVQETVNVPETYCVMVPYTKTVRVPASQCAY